MKVSKDDLKIRMFSSLQTALIFYFIHELGPEITGFDLLYSYVRWLLFWSLAHSLTHLCRIIKTPITYLATYHYPSYIHTTVTSRTKRSLSHVINNQLGTQAMASKYLGAWLQRGIPPTTHQNKSYNRDRFLTYIRGEFEYVIYICEVIIRNL